MSVFKSGFFCLKGTVYDHERVKTLCVKQNMPPAGSLSLFFLIWKTSFFPLYFEVSTGARALTRSQLLPNSSIFKVRYLKDHIIFAIRSTLLRFHEKIINLMSKNLGCHY